MRRLRVLTLLNKPVKTGGAERMAFTIATGLDPERFDRYLCSTRLDPPPEIGAELRAAGVRYLGLGRSRRFELGAWARFVRFLRRERIDVIHAHMFGSNVWGSILGRLAGVPVVVAHEHTWAFSGQPVRVALNRHVVARLADTIVAVSAEDRRKLIEFEKIPPARITLVPNGIAPGEPTEGRDVRAELGIPAGAPVVASVTVIRPQKRIDRLVEAAALLRAEHPDLRVLVVGDGYPDEVRRVEEVIRATGTDATVMLLGQRSDVPDVLRAADVGVLSSDFEGSPLAVMEYMAAGLPVVATAVGGVPELVLDGETGILVPEPTPDALAAGLSTVLRDRALGERLGARGREVQRERYSIRSTIERLSDLYEELYRSSGRAAGRG